MKIPYSLLILIVIVTTVAGQQVSKPQVEEPVSAERLVGLLKKRFAVTNIIETIKARGVGFQSLKPIEDEIREAGNYLPQRELNSLLSTAADNFRPPAPAPYRVTFMSLKGVAVNLFLDRSIDKHWDEILGTRNYFIARNDVYRSLMLLVAKFSSANFGQRYFSNESAEPMSPQLVDFRENRKLAQFYRINRKPLFVGSVGEPSGDGWPFPGVATDYVSTFARSLNDPDKQWRLIAASPDEAPAKKGVQPMDLYTFRKFLEKDELKLFTSSRLGAFYSHITRNYLPPEFAVIDLFVKEVQGEEEEYNEACPETSEKLKTAVGLTGPLLILNVAVLENTSEKPISTGRLFIKSYNAESLRTRVQDAVNLNSVPFQTLKLFSAGLLKPGEKLVIPIDLSLMHEGEGWDTPAEGQVGSEDFAPALSKVRQAGGLRFPGLRRRLLVTTDSFEKILSRPKIDFFKTPEYLYGPSVSIEGVEIDSYSYLVRDYKKEDLYVTTGGYESGGSCPYVYTYTDGKWLNEGTILYGKNSKLKEAIDEKVLRRFDGRILIKERDPETSFIDLIEIRATTHDGLEKVLYARNPQLRFTDGQYVKLEQGQELMIEFEVPSGFVANKYVIVASGYYVPYGRSGRSAPRQLLTRRIYKRPSSRFH